MRITKLALNLLATIFVLSALPLAAQSSEERIQMQLNKLMSQELTLTDDDIRIYLANADAIYRLRHDYELLPSVLNGIGAWSPARFAYVTTKMAVGMSLLMTPSDPRNRNLADFMRPTASELDLMRRYQNELTRVMERVQARYSTPAATQ